MVHALWLGWTLLLLRHLGNTVTVLSFVGEGGGGGGGGGECYDLLGFIVSPVDAASVW